MAGWVGIDGRGRRPRRLARIDGRAARRGRGACRRSATRGRARRDRHRARAWGRAARVAARAGIERHAPRAVVYSTTTAALLWPRPGAIRFDAPAAANRPGRHGLWQRPLEARRLATTPLLLPWDSASLDETPHPHADALVIPIAVAPSPATAAARDITAITYAANPQKKGLDRVLSAWAQAHRDGEQLVVAGAALQLGDVPGVRVAGRLAPAEYRALLRRARVFVTAPRREDYGIAQLEALADGCLLVTTAAPGPYAALPLARSLDPRLVTDDAGLGTALRCALDSPAPDYAQRAATALARFSPAAVDAVVRDELLPRLLQSG
jgi:hypothetical protein